jgi:pimeloyl-ACP methyl ester carboxylesterase
LKPYIDQNYRTQPDAAHTGIIGSSMGGLISLYGGLAYNNVFGRVGVLSPSLWFSDSIYTLAKATSPAQTDTRIYFASGRQESATQVQEQARMVQTLQQAGWAVPSQLDSMTRNGTHSESLWRITFPLAYKHLFAANPTTSARHESKPHVSVYPSPGGHATELNVQAEGVAEARVVLCNAVGQEMATTTLLGGKATLTTANLPFGLYVVQVHRPEGVIMQRWVK